MTERNRIELRCIEISQPIGDYYIASIPFPDLIKITTVDVRQIDEMKDGIYSYTGIQRKLNKSRAKKIGEFTNSHDACFPTSVVLSVDGRCVSFDKERSSIYLHEAAGDEEEGIPPIAIDEIARVIDGQHRIEGLKDCRKDKFDINVAIFVDIDPAVEGYVFSTVNLHQSKVSKSLAYDLYALAKERSPQKMCHNIAVALDAQKTGPFHRKIKRLGKAEAHNIPASITQAAFVKSLLRYISTNEMKDRSIYLEGGIPPRLDEMKDKLIFRKFLIDERELDLAKILMNYFSAVRDCWPDAWSSQDKGIMLSRTNGFQGLMRFLRPAYNYFYEDVPTKEQFLSIFLRIRDGLGDNDFTTANFPPGSSGEVALYRRFIALSKLNPNQVKGRKQLFD